MSESLDRTGKLVAAGVFVALMVDGMDLQMLSLVLPSLMKELGISSVMAGALSTYTLLGMGIGGILAGWLSDRIGRVRVTWWAVMVFSVCTALIAFCVDAVRVRLRHRGRLQHRHLARR
jgi:AAHS family cis,cis-muconate transporter-like MFS transporter